MGRVRKKSNISSQSQENTCITSIKWRKSWDKRGRREEEVPIYLNVLSLTKRRLAENRARSQDQIPNS
jgi:hypothetical protein